MCCKRASSDKYDFHHCWGPNAMSGRCARVRHASSWSATHKILRWRECCAAYPPGCAVRRRNALKLPRGT
eukprot:2411385-Amphidinium_carterae.2